MKHHLIKRIRAEMEIMAAEVGGNSVNSDRIQAGKLSVGGKEYIGVIVRNLSVRPESFARQVKSVNALILVPGEYPRIPPLGIYVDQPYKAASSHFVHKGYYGAPSLHEKGWYWFCHGFGNFNSETASWHPTASPTEGHNLATVLAGARVAMNQ